MRVLLFIFLLSLSFATQLKSQSFSVCGSVADAQGEVLPGVAVYAQSLKKGTATDENGEYCLDLPKGEYQLKFQFLGMRDSSISILVNSDLTLNVKMQEASVDMSEVEITGNQSTTSQGTQADMVKIDAKVIEQLPELMGDSDPIRAVTLGAGINSNNEGVAGILVRGGGIDQNLFTLDNGILFNPTHMGGLFSVVNSDLLESVEVYKGVQPAKYGRRASSVVNMNLRRGEMDSSRVAGNIGLLSSKIYASAPLRRKKAALQVSARTTYINQWANLARSLQPEGFIDAGYGFYDMTGKLTWVPSERDIFAVTGHYNADKFHLNSEEGTLSNEMKWASRMIVANHSRYLDKGVWSSFLSYSGYDFQFDAQLNQNSLAVQSNIKDYSFGVNWEGNENGIEYGVQGVLNQMVPNDKRVTTSQGAFEFNDNQVYQSIQVRPYFSWATAITRHGTLTSALHGAGYRHFGDFKLYQTDELNHVSDTVNYSGWDAIFKRFLISPRVNLNWAIGDSSSITIDWSRNQQFMHLASISSVSFPADFWLPSTTGVEPQIVGQWSAVYQKIMDQYTRFNIGAFYKQMDNLIAYQYGMIGSFESYNLSDDLIFGEGHAYGAEIEVQYEKARWQTRIAYTYARTFRQFDAVNDGQKFVAKYDHPHDLSAYVSFQPNEKWSLSALFVLVSGNNMTVPASRYIIEEGLINTYNPRNGYRMPLYHRMDLAATRKVMHGRRFNSEWKFSVYNVYNRENPFLIYFAARGDLARLKLNVEARQVTLFPILPSISYKFTF